MRAVVQSEYGEAERVLSLATIDRPEPGPDEVLVRVAAAGVDRGAWHLMAGLPYPVRLAGYGMRAPKTPVRGRELAGTVESVGARVTTLRPGEEVCGIAEGAFAEYAVARAELLVPRPTGLTACEAAAIPLSGLTALQAVRDHGRVTAGQRVLVIGASGGVGSFAAQVATAAGAEVTGACRTAKVEAVRGLGIHRVIDYTLGPLAEAGSAYDVVIDTGGHRPLSELRRMLAPRGTLVIVGSETGGKVLGGTERQLWATVIAPFTGHRMGSFISSENGADLRELTALIEAGRVRPLVDRVYPLAGVPAAITRMVAGLATGKIVIDVTA
ncbi:NAD(P)-dependent alcohol dehydrogenase [Klugiella xanthotipulae]